MAPCFSPIGLGSTRSASRWNTTAANDPGETRNLYGQPQHHAVQQELWDTPAKIRIGNPGAESNTNCIEVSHFFGFSINSSSVFAHLLSGAVDLVGAPGVAHGRQPTTLPGTIKPKESSPKPEAVGRLVNP
jgi:hypothetical protein